ncbi:hypothetical protein OF83DRAFT_1126127 [Amylostereum chailletii]|nr:hypothetical protein OF83DRAFT_1126127 [Amylostereum chailletii]
MIVHSNSFFRLHLRTVVMASYVAPLRPLFNIAQAKIPQVLRPLCPSIVRGVLRLIYATNRSDLTNVMDSLNSFTFNSLKIFIAWPYAILLTLVLLPIFKRSQTSSPPSNPLIALQAIIIPTQSRWPDPYRALAKPANSTKTVIILSLSTLIQDIVSGTVELRDPEHDLPFLVGGGILAQGFRIRLRIDFSFRWRTAWSTYWSRCISCSPQLHVLSAQLLTRVEDIDGQSPSSFSRSPSFPRQAFLVDLDFVPSHKLEAFFNHLHKTLPEDSRLTLSFTTAEPSFSVSYRSYAVVGLPYLPGSLRLPSSCPARTLSALSTSLPQALELLEGQFIVDSVENISASYSSAICQAADVLKDDPGARDAFVGQYGMEGWRAERFRGLWEAALLKEGRLTKWKITVRTVHGPEAEGGSV